MDRIELAEHDLVGLRADNPGPLTLSGTNSWIVGVRPAWLIDPGPALPAHLRALIDELERRGGLGGIALTHDHASGRSATSALTAFVWTRSTPSMTPARSTSSLRSRGASTRSGPARS
jgi:hypothetical protein